MNKLKYYSINLMLSYFIALFFLFISSVIFTYTSINDNYIDVFVFVSVGISVLIGSMLMSRKIKTKGIVSGIAFGIIYLLLLYILTVMLYKGFFVSNTLLMYLGISVLAGSIGGIIGVNI